MAEVAVTEKKIAEISEDGAVPLETAAKGDGVLTPEAGGKTLIFLTKG
jgi:hypothetical protein